MLGARPVRSSAIADPVFVIGDRLQQGRGSGHCLSTGREVLALKNVLLEEFVGTGTVFAAVNGDRSVLAADLLPVPDFAGDNGLKLRKAQFLNLLVLLADVDGQSIQANLV